MVGDPALRLAKARIMNTLHIALGAPASGKTTLARHLAERHRAALLDIDIATEAVVRSAMKALDLSEDDRDSPRYKEIFRQPIYDCLFANAAANLPCIDVVVTGPFTSEQGDPGWLDKVQARLGVPCEIRAYYLSCDSETRLRRMRERANPRDASKLADWAGHQSRYSEGIRPKFPHQFVDTTSEGWLDQW